MNSILLQVQQYLDSVSKEPVKLDKQLVQEFGEACKNALLKQFEETRRDKFETRMSNIGRPLCQLQMEAKGIKGEGQPYNNKMRNTFGDLIEALAIFVMKSSGIKITNEQKKVNYKFNGDSIEGRQDVEIDGKIWDIKSASPYSFEKKFGEAGGFNEVVREDSFGYASQGFLYAESQSKDFGGWIVINKSTGEWAVCETPKLVEPHKSDAIKKAEDVIKSIPETYKTCWLNMMRKKLGLVDKDNEDENIINSLLSWMEKNNADFTNTFIDLMNEENFDQSIYKSNDFKNWLEIYKKRKLSKNFSKSKSIKLMQENNPVIIPRNHIVENVLSSADEGDLKPLNKFLKILENPYDNNLKISNYYKTDIKSGEPYMTFCGT